MRAYGGAATRGLVAAFGILILVASCDEGDIVPEADGGEGGAAGAPIGGAGGSGTSAGEGGALAGASGGPAAECAEDSDCVAINECYPAACQAGECVDVPAPRGTPCASGLCNGFARCVTCLDDAPGVAEDSGCSEGSPMCVDIAGEATCVGCRGDSDCSDGVECTADRCTDATCEHLQLPLGAACEGGVCDGEGTAQSCVACVDDASEGADTGCSEELPRCDTAQSPAACATCNDASDCDDDRACTTDVCRAGACEHVTLVSGTPCPDGYCNGIAGVEECVVRQCLIDADCDDHVTCTVDTCEALRCAYTTDDAECPDSGDACSPNVCTVGSGCLQVEKTRSVELLANGTFEAGNVAWLEEAVTYDQVIFGYGYIPTLQPHTWPYVAWLGNGEPGNDEQNRLSQVVSVPEGTVRLELTFFYEVWTDELPDDQNRMTVSLRSTDGSDEELLATFHNQDATRVWTRFSTSIDAAPWAGSELELELSGASSGGFTAFFVDSVSLMADVCE
jgi:hypothetical protein